MWMSQHGPEQPMASSVKTINAWRMALPHPTWLVGKRVQIWSEGNQAFLEADVINYEPSSALHRVVYVIDKVEREENLLDPSSNWDLVEESQEELSIKKRSRTDLVLTSDSQMQASTPISDEVLRGVSTNSSMSLTTNSISVTKKDWIHKVRKTVPLTYQTAEFMVLNTFEGNLTEDKDPMAQNLILIDKLSRYFYRDYVKVFPGKAVDDRGLFTEIVLFGAEDAVRDIEQRISETCLLTFILSCR
jgi:hypothetical protein